MKRMMTPILLLVIVIIAGAMIYQNSIMTELIKHTADGDEIVRIYVGLTAEDTGGGYEMADVEKILASHFEGATIQEAAGFHNGVKEKSAIISIVNCCSWKEPKTEYRKRVIQLAQELRRELGQESILIEAVSNGHIGAIEIAEQFISPSPSSP